MQHPHPERPIDVLDESKVASFDDVLLDDRSAVQGDLLGVLEQTRVREAELAFETLLLGGVTPEWWGGPFD